VGHWRLGGDGRYGGRRGELFQSCLVGGGGGNGGGGGEEVTQPIVVRAYKIIRVRVADGTHRVGAGGGGTKRDKAS